MQYIYNVWVKYVKEKKRKNKYIYIQKHTKSKRNNLKKKTTQKIKIQTIFFLKTNKRNKIKEKKIVMSYVEAMLSVEAQC